MIILHLLEQKPMHGYLIIAQIRSTFGILLRPGKVYPLLGILEENGYVKSQWKRNVGRPKKLYSLTLEGKRFLEFTKEWLILVCKNLTVNGKTNTFIEIAVEKSSLQGRQFRSIK